MYSVLCEHALVRTKPFGSAKISEWVDVWGPPERYDDVKDTEEENLLHGLSKAIGNIAHTCSDFGSYVAQLQRGGCDTGRCDDLDIGPTMDEARKDYRATLCARIRPLTTSVL